MKIEDVRKKELQRALKATELLLGPDAQEVQALRRELARRRERWLPIGEKGGRP